MGHGPQAATVMSRLSAAAYALADLGLQPAEVLQQLNRTALALPQATLATCAYAVIDPGRQPASSPPPATFRPSWPCPMAPHVSLACPAASPSGSAWPATGRPASSSCPAPSSPCTPTAWWKPVS